MLEHRDVLDRGILLDVYRGSMSVGETFNIDVIRFREISHQGQRLFRWEISDGVYHNQDVAYLGPEQLDYDYVIQG